MVTDGKLGMKLKTQAEGGGCTHCGNMKHTMETCFKLHGYPDWWHELKTKKKHESGRATLVSDESISFSSIKPHLSLISQQQQIIPWPRMNQVTTVRLLILGQLIT